MTSAVLPLGEDVEDICGKEELVSFSDVSSRYPANQSLTVKYQLGSRVQTSPSDWIGIFQDQWDDVTRPLTYISLSNAERGQSKPRRKSVTFSTAAIKTLSGKKESFQFVYVNANQHVLGVSFSFKLDDGDPTSLCEVEEAEEIDRGSEWSDSPVLISSASEDEDGEWDSGHPSHTSDTLLQVGPGGSSASDLSDIVVLSTSPSQEAARLAQDQVPHSTGEARLADILGRIWSMGSSGGHGGTEKTGSEEGPRKIGKPMGHEGDVKDVVNPVRDKNKKIVYTHSEEKCLASDTMRETIEDSPRDDEILDIEDITVIVDAPAIIKTLDESCCHGNPFFKKLQIVELDNTSGEEDNKDEEEVMKNEKIVTQTPYARKCSTLITEITEAEAMTVKNQKDNVKIKSSQDVKTVTSSKNITNSETNETNKKPVKKTKKKKRDKERETSVEYEEAKEAKKAKESKLPFEAFLDALLQTENSHCYEDEVISGPSVSQCKNVVQIKNKLAFDELLEASVNNLKDFANQAKKKKQPKAPTHQVYTVACDEGELYSCCLPTPLKEVNNTKTKSQEEPSTKTKLLKPNRAKKAKQSKLVVNQIEDETENALMQNNADSKDLLDDASKTTGNVVETGCSGLGLSKIEENSVTADGPSNASGVLEEEEAAAKKKSRRDMRTKALKKASRVSSSKKKKTSQLSCEFQYLFSIDVKRREADGEDAISEPKTSEDTVKTSLDAAAPAIPLIVDTSEDGFPALPSQHENTKLKDCPDIPLKDITREENPIEELDVEQDQTDGAKEDLMTFPPEGVETREGFFPYAPPYVLDVMDALPPASVSPDGRAMVEWKRSLLPLLPKHTLPVFHNKYKAKYGRKQDLRRTKLRRASMSRNFGIMDRIRHQLAVPGVFHQVAKSWPKSPLPVDLVTRRKEANLLSNQPQADDMRDVDPATVPEQPPSYASVVKKALDTKPEGSERVEQALLHGTEDAAPDEQINMKCSVPCIVVESPSSQPEQDSPLVEPDQDTKLSSATKEGNLLRERKDTGMVCKTSNNFPKEYTCYTSEDKTKRAPITLQPSSVEKDLLFLPTMNATPGDGATNSPNASLFSAVFLTPPTGADSETGEKACENDGRAAIRQFSHKLETPALHIRPTGKSQPKTLPGSPPRKTKGKALTCCKQKASAPCNHDQTSETEEQKALVDMALSSCLADNAQLRSTVVSLEKQLRTLKSERQRKATGTNSTQGQDISPMGQKFVQKNKALESPRRLSPHRKVAVCKWAGKMAHMVRSNVEVINLSTKVKGYEQELASLTNQVNALKEALQVETKRSRRALTKWFKAKLKVKVLRSRIRELQAGESAPSAALGEVFTSPPPPSSTERDRSCTSMCVERPEETREVGEPPCKRPKLDPSLDANQKEDLNATDTTKLERKDSGLLPPPISQRAQDYQAQANPLRAAHSLPFTSPPIGPFFNFFSVSSGENGKLMLDPTLTQHQTQPTQQAVVPPFYHNIHRPQVLQADVNQLYLQQQQQQLRHQQQHEQQHHPHNFDHFTNGMYSVQQPPKLHPLLNPQDSTIHLNDHTPTLHRQTCQKKKSPPHLPLPTPPRTTQSPPTGHLLPRQNWKRSSHARHPPQDLTSADALYPPVSQASCLPPGWVLPQNNHPMVETSLGNKRPETSFLSPWSTFSPPSSTWNVNDLERNHSLYAPLHANPDVESPVWIPNTPARFPVENFLKPSIHTENNKEFFQAPQNSFGIGNRPFAPDAYYRDEPSQAGPCRKPLSTVQLQPQGAGLVRGTQPASPPGKYRSNFMRRLMKGEAVQAQKQPNPYRLFNRGSNDEPSREEYPNQGFVGLYQFPGVESPEGQTAFTEGTQPMESPTGALASQLMTVNKPEVSYRNTPGFIELTAEGLVETTAPFFIDYRHGNYPINGNNNSIECKDNSISKKLRPIESQPAFDNSD